ncbi:nonstructural protein [Blackfly microvirus SF02]|uniref:Nonstructural protein n=1 Tax=Blackfly microvirus SF02 TaxID=2576452 RepID=A0A4P8PK14_9VIRU|nr:nonstructural protein [Blackfly microvirus SF02]
MRIQTYAVFDKAVSAFLQPFYARTRGEALRSFVQACNEEGSQFNRHAADYVMFFVGEFDDQSGMYHPQEPERVIGALECREADIFPAAKQTN